MSFALDCKEEIMTNKKKLDENKAMLLGLILSGAKIDDNKISFISTSLKIANYFNFILKRTFNIEGTLIEDDLKSSSFLHTYIVLINDSKDLIEELEINNFGEFKHKIENNQSLACAYLSGAFLARGSVNDPNTSKYHFEITLEDRKNAVFVQQIINNLNFNSKIIKRRNKIVIYIKDAEKIVDILRLMGANKNAFHYEDIRIERDFNNSINRVINCEVANEQKTISAAREQLRYIKYLEYNYPLETLDIKILTLMKARKDNPEATLNELIEIMQNKYGETISKSGLYHRFSKIKSIADEHYKNTKR